MFSSFMINTWIVATIAAAVAGIVGFFVVVRGSSFAAHALPLGAFPGAAAAHLLGVNQLFGLVVFSGAGVLGISQLARHNRQEVATALCLVMLLGFGALFLSMTSEYSQEVYALLFGEVFGVSGSDIVVIAAIGSVSIAAVMVLFRPLLLSSLSPDLAQAQGVSGQTMQFCFLTILALTTVTTLPVVGALLVFTLMVGPAAAARSMTDRPVAAMLLSAAISMIVVWASVALSYTSNWPVGFYVGILSAFCYIVGRLFAKLRHPYPLIAV